MRKIKWPKIGQYVLVTYWSDKDPYDPWYVGHIELLSIHGKDISYKVRGSKRNWRYCHKITSDEGADWLRLYSKTT